MNNQLSPYLPRTIQELLPKTADDSKIAFIAFGPLLIDSLSKGENIIEAANNAGIDPQEAARLIATPEFIKYVEAYLSLGDITDRASRIRLAKAILASQIASGVSSKKKEPLDILEYIRKETDTKRGGGGVQVNIVNNSVPRPYGKQDNSLSNGAQKRIETLTETNDTQAVHVIAPTDVPVDANGRNQGPAINGSTKQIPGDKLLRESESVNDG